EPGDGAFHQRRMQLPGDLPGERFRAVIPGDMRALLLGAEPQTQVAGGNFEGSVLGGNDDSKTITRFHCLSDTQPTPSKVPEPYRGTARSSRLAPTACGCARSSCPAPAVRALAASRRLPTHNGRLAGATRP